MPKTTDELNHTKILTTKSVYSEEAWGGVRTLLNRHSIKWCNWPERPCYVSYDPSPGLYQTHRHTHTQSKSGLTDKTQS